MKPLSILFLGTQMAVGGAQKVLLDQAGWFHARGHRVTAAFFYDRDSLREKWQAEFPFPILCLSGFHKGRGILQNGFSILGGLARLWILLRRERFDVVETFTHDSNTLALPLAWVAGVPVRIASHHGIVAGIRPWREKIHAWLVNRGAAQRIVAVSALTRRKLLEEGIAAEKIIVIPNGIAPVEVEGVDKTEVRKKAGIGADDPFLLAVGRLVPSKAHRVLIDAMPLVLERFPSAKAGVCGNGPLRGELEEQIRTLGLEDSVRLLGHSEHVAQFLASADVFVMPSLWEGLPIALLEAMSAGLPVAATRVEGVEEVVEEGRHGFLAPPGDKDALAEALLRLLQDPAARRRMGEAAREKVLEKYTAERMCRAYLSLMERIQSKRPEG
ncbi:MAG: glycosyltransferase family 4 protein [Chloroflexi bacterium]|nr:glycosyltransferase family 4 protein [Chloroflexota bacterium]